MLSTDSAATRLSTRLLFLVAGFGYSCWAPLVPIAKSRLAIDEHVLGLLILCIGLGSITAMIATGALTTRFGSKPILIGSGFGLAAALALLPVANTTMQLGLALFAFGAMLGALDVAMNLQAVEVERAAGRPLMSGFHAFFSIGGFAGSAFMTFLLSIGIEANASTLISSSLMVVAMAIVVPRLIDGSVAKGGPLFALPRGFVLLLALLASVAFLVEGALLDWGALLITDAGLVSVAQGGMGYMIFSVAMTAGRLGGDSVSMHLGDRRTLLWGGLIALLGFMILLTISTAGIALSGFALIGLGCSNIVPVLFRRAAVQTSMPSGLAIAAITTTGYAGILAGPAGIGFIAEKTSLHFAFWLLAGLLAFIPVCAKFVAVQRGVFAQIPSKNYS